MEKSGLNRLIEIELFEDGSWTIGKVMVSYAYVKDRVYSKRREVIRLIKTPKNLKALVKVDGVGQEYYLPLSGDLGKKYQLYIKRA